MELPYTGSLLSADRVQTPLLNITGDQDPNVPARQSREMYYALRRLRKEVEWVRYLNGGHRPPNSAAESADFERRIVAWYHQHLKQERSKKAEDQRPGLALIHREADPMRESGLCPRSMPS